MADAMRLTRRKSQCESNDPVDLYGHPPAKAAVLCVDEKPSIPRALQPPG
jgi:hypothetical protein